MIELIGRPSKHERVQLRLQAWRQEHADELRAYARGWREAHREEIRANGRAYYRLWVERPGNREYQAAYMRERRARKRQERMEQEANGSV